MGGFLREKLANVRVGDLVFMQLESLAVWLVGSLPTLAGYVLRYAVYRLLFKRIGGMCWIQPGVTFVQSNRLSIGKHFGCNSGTYINAIGGITLGNYVLLGANVTISSGKHDIEGRDEPVFARPSVPRAIVIEDDVWIAAGVVIMPGITIRRGSVIGANAVVTRDTDEYGVYAGAPARKLRER